MNGDSERLVRMEERLVHLVDQQARFLQNLGHMDGRLRTLETQRDKAAGLATAGRILWTVASSGLGASLAVYLLRGVHMAP